MNRMNTNAEYKYPAITTIIVISLLAVGLTSVYTIKSGQRGVLSTFGEVSSDTIQPGLHFKLPLIQKIVKFDTTTQKYQAKLSAASRDLQDVNTEIAINYHVVPGTVAELYTTIGIDYADKVVYPIEQEANKGITAQFTAEELITKREEVRDRMITLLTDRLGKRNIVVEDISIVDFKFSDEFNKAIEAKVTAEQNALAAKNKLEQVKYEAQQKIEAANGEAEAIRVKANALMNNPLILQLNAIDKWDGKMPQYVGTSAPLPFIGVTGTS